jgi:glyoxylase-like metal-dependent hydrolase (beta-lactamase superfamily II)
MLRHSGLSGATRRSIRFLLGGLLAVLSDTAYGADTPALDGALANRGAEERAEQHQLPAQAIDTHSLPATRLTAQDSDSATLPLYRLAPDTYFLYGNIATLDADNRGFNGNAGFVVTGAGVVVIDALGTPKLGKRLIATIRSVTEQPIKYLILTHNHPDHAYGASAFRAIAGISIVGHRGLLEYRGSETMQRSVDYRRELLPQDMADFRFVEPDIYAPEQPFRALRLELGGQRFDVYNAGQHHSHGDLVVHQLDAGILWISDLAFNQRVTFMGDGHSTQAIDGQDWLLEQFGDARLMVPGHGSAQRPPFPMVGATRAYIQQLRDRMKQKVIAGVPLLDALEDAAMPAWRDLPLYDENQRANASFVYREMELEFF